MIYFDNAATTFPKPEFVSEEVYKCLRFYCGNPGRSAHALSLRAAEKVFECRALISELFSAGDPSRVVFTQNTTASLNMAIKGLLRAGDHVIISDMEHNAVLRPIKKLSALGLIDHSVYHSGSRDGVIDGDRIVSEIASLIRPTTRLVVTVHGSNICSAVMPIDKIGKLCAERGLMLVVDGAGSAGHVGINVTEDRVSALCIPAHKGLYGPQGCGALVLGKEVRPETLIEGGNGIDSRSPEMSAVLPERYEAGTLPTPAIAGLCEGIKAVKRTGIDAISRLERELYDTLLRELSDMRGVTLYAPQHRGNVLLFNLDGVPSEEVGRALSRAGICVRCGYHCAPLPHSTLATPEGGAVRVSFGMYNTKKEISALVDELYRIRKG